MEKEKIIAIIPARGGSKGIPRKNIKLFCGKPLLAWKVEAAIKSGIFDRIILSTDDQEIAEVGKKYKAEILFMRPKELAVDTTPTIAVLQHAITWLLDNEQYFPDAVAILEPTTPGVESFHLQEAWEIFKKTKADSVISILDVPSQFNPFWQFTISKNNQLSLFSGDHIKKIIRRRQDLPTTYYRNSALYIFNPKLLFDAAPSFYGEKVYGYIMDKKYSMDLDRPEDWEVAENEFQNIHSIFNK